MDRKIHVLIIEDDFRVAAINRQFVEQIEAYQVVNSVKTAQEAYQYLQMPGVEVDLVLLDIYIPDVEGLELFWRLRSQYRAIDIVIVSAAAEAKVFEEVLRGGIFDYIIKPVDADRFTQMLKQYEQRRHFLSSKETLEQHEVDILTQRKVNRFPNKTNKELPKGIDPITLEEVTNLLKYKKVKGITAVELSEQIGTSRSTARRYLEYLVALKKIRTTLLYGNVGRPERFYVPCETYEQNATNKN